MMIGRKQATYAIRRWQQCMKSDVWPGYGLSWHTASPPPWIEQRWMAREMSDPFATGATELWQTLAKVALYAGVAFGAVAAFSPALFVCTPTNSSALRGSPMR